MGHFNKNGDPFLLYRRRFHGNSRSLFRSLVTDFGFRYCEILASRWGCPECSVPTEKTEPDELRIADWTMSDPQSDAKIEFVYFGLRGADGFATVCIKGRFGYTLYLKLSHRAGSVFRS
jgi:hypothetical protein